MDEREGELQLLTECCDPATFGVDAKDVLDITYRSAGKLDKKHFATNLDLPTIGVLDIIRNALLEGEQSLKPIKVELYKMNVYGKLSLSGGDFLQTNDC